MDEPNSPPSPPTRQTSASTGVSYLSTGRSSLNLRRLYIFIHGWACSGSDYIPLLSTLSASGKEALYVAPDLPGHGRSPRSICPNPTVTSFANLINHYRHELCSTSLVGVETILVGHSMGCRIVLEVFSQEPRNVTGIVLLDGSWYGPKSPKEENQPTTSVDKDQELQLILCTLPTMFGPSTPDYFKQQVVQHMREIDLDYMNLLSNNYIAWDGERMEDVMNIIIQGQGNNDDSETAETWVLLVQATEGHGGKRRSLKKSDEGPWMRFVKDRVGERYRSIVVEGSGHWPHVDRVEEVARAIRNLEEKGVRSDANSESQEQRRG
jgi:pimeloyl-ACP methyl ester carboxylesterase